MTPYSPAVSSQERGTGGRRKADIQYAYFNPVIISKFFLPLSKRSQPGFSI
ncbi:MAG: hypothetical protein F6K21_12180 [Symploca sp. SIO2D2]|nr:hypothetical protein [Symploca sp. SIO2D2]